MSMPKKWYKFDQGTRDFASASFDVLLGFKVGPDGQYPPSIELLEPDGSLMFSDVFFMQKRLYALRSALGAVFEQGQKFWQEVPLELRMFLYKQVSVRPFRVGKGEGRTTPAGLVIVGQDSPYRTKPKAVQLFERSPMFTDVQIARQQRALRDILGENAKGYVPNIPFEEWKPGLSPIPPEPEISWTEALSPFKVDPKDNRNPDAPPDSVLEKYKGEKVSREEPAKPPSEKAETRPSGSKGEGTSE